jgi:hypothetical protein
MDPRYLLVPIVDRDILDVLAGKAIVVTPDFDHLDGVKVMGVWHDFKRDCFLVKVYHESFSEVPEGAEIPQVSSVSIRSREEREDCGIVNADDVEVSPHGKIIFSSGGSIVSAERM